MFNIFSSIIIDESPPLFQKDIEHCKNHGNMYFYNFTCYECSEYCQLLDMVCKASVGAFQVSFQNFEKRYPSDPINV